MIDTNAIATNVKLSAEIEKLTHEYLARGGAITVLSPSHKKLLEFAQFPEIKDEFPSAFKKVKGFTTLYQMKPGAHEHADKHSYLRYTI